MKRISAIVIFVIAFCFMAATNVLAEDTGIDINSMSIEELVALRTKIDDEITNRTQSEANVLYPGLYFVGTDIEAGEYILTSTVDESVSGSTPQALYASSAESAKKVDYIDSITAVAGESWRVNLQEGMVLEIRYANFLIQKAPALTIN